MTGSMPESSAESTHQTTEYPRQAWLQGGVGLYPSRSSRVLSREGGLAFSCCGDQGRFSPFEWECSGLFPISFFSVVPELIGVQAP